MIIGMFNALSGLRAFMQQLQSNANNLANLQTSGLKKSHDSYAAILGNPETGNNGITISDSFELSNSDVTEELVGQIKTQDACTANTKIISSANEIIGRIIDIKS